MPTRPDPKVQPLSTNEQADGGYTHCLVLEPADFADTTTADEDKTITIFTAMAGDVIEKSKLELVTAFKDASDAAFNSTLFTFGDEDDPDRFLSVQVNENGTEVLSSFENTAYGPYTAAKDITITLESMAAKSLSNLDTGKLVLLFTLNRGRVLAESAA